jgi:hypothetical protein
VEITSKRAAGQDILSEEANTAKYICSKTKYAAGQPFEIHIMLSIT